MVAAFDVRTTDDRMLRAYDTGANEPTSLTLIWHHGSPQTGAPLDPVLAAAAERGIRLLSYGRPSYGGSSPSRGRDVASAAADVAAIADAANVARFAVMGASGGGPHALACAALLPERVSAVVTVAGLAPRTDAFDWFGGMRSPQGLQAALAGRDARARQAGTDEFDPEQFIAADVAALEQSWASLGEDVARSAEWGDDGLIDDDVAFTAPWGFELARVVPPTLLVQGALDRIVPRSHAEWMLERMPNAELWRRPEDGHISVLDAIPAAMDWLLADALTPRSA
jgi:pimeloyl-ACP methyl ester carboxylesterase